MSTVRMITCDYCGKTREEKGYQTSLDWYTLWGYSKNKKEDPSYDLCSLKCVRKKVKKLK